MTILIMRRRSKIANIKLMRMRRISTFLINSVETSSIVRTSWLVSRIISSLSKCSGSTTGITLALATPPPNNLCTGTGDRAYSPNTTMGGLHWISQLWRNNSSHYTWYWCALNYRFYDRYHPIQHSIEWITLFVFKQPHLLLFKLLKTNKNTK